MPEEWTLYLDPSTDRCVLIRAAQLPLLGTYARDRLGTERVIRLRWPPCQMQPVDRKLLPSPSGEGQGEGPVD
jgi:hypothetical protein